MYIVIETFDRYFPCIVVNPDDGMPLLFDTEEEAQNEADQCQSGIVVKI
jgi:hypothetical protein